MKRPIIINATRNAALPESVQAGKPITIQLAPEGKYPQFVDDPEAEGGMREVVQILDKQAMETLVANFEKERAEAEAKGQKYAVLVDADHSSETSHDTAAMGWVTKLYIDPEKGLMAEIEPTTLGAEKINGKVYRFVSGAWTLDDDNRPDKLVSIGLTNKPNLPVNPMINAAKPGEKDAAGTRQGVTPDEPEPDNAKAADDKGGESAAGAPGDEGGKHKDEPQNGVVNMDIKAKLGLPGEATDADVEKALDAILEKCAGIEKVQNALGLEADCENDELLEAVNTVLENCKELQAQNEEIEAKNAEIEKAKLNAEAEQLVADNADVIPEEDADAIKNEYVEDPEKAKKTVENYRRVYERAVVNAARAAGKVDAVHKPFRNSDAHKPAILPSAGVAAIVASCNGDPVAINAAIARMKR